MDIKSETCEVEQVDHVKIEMTQLANVTNDSWTHENKPLLDEDWRNIKKDLKLEDQLMLMQDNRILVDCQIVSKANLPKVCHKVCLARISPDLERHFQSSSILSVDCDDDTCQALIRYAYTNTVLSNTAEPLLNLYRLAKKISCDRLMEICLQKFRGCLKAETAMCNFDMLDIEEDYDFAQQCIEFIAAHANNILKNITPFVYKTGTGSLKCLSTIKVKMILSEENMNISSEVVLLTAVQLWAEYHVKQQGKQPSYSTIKAEVKTLLPKLRILSLDEAELTEFFHITRMLTEEEQRMIAAYHTGKSSRPLLTTPNTPALPDSSSPPKDLIPSDPRPRKRHTTSSPADKRGSKRVDMSKTPPASTTSNHKESICNSNKSVWKYYSKQHKEGNGHSETTGKPDQRQQCAANLSQLKDFGSFCDCAMLVRDADHEGNSQIYLLHRIYVGRFEGHLLDLISGPTSEYFIRDESNLPSLPLFILDAEVSLATFEIIMKYLYNDEYSCNSKELPRVISLAKSWNMLPLVDKCLNQLQYSLCERTVWFALSVASKHRHHSVIKHCYELIKKSPLKCFKISDDELRTISSDTMMKISELSTIDVPSEAHIITFVESWAKAKLSGCGNVPNDKQIRGSIPNIIKNLRFLALTLEDFNERVSKTYLLDERDRNAVFAHLSGNVGGIHTQSFSKLISTNNQSRFKTYHVGPTKYKSFDVPKDERNVVKQIVTKTAALNASIQFHTDKPIKLYGFTIKSQHLPGNLNQGGNQKYDESIKFTVSVVEKIPKLHISKMYIREEKRPKVDYNSNIQILFDKPFKFEPKKFDWCVIKLQLEQEGTYQFEEIKRGGKVTIKKTFMDVQFSCCNSEDFCGTGGIFESLLVSKIDPPPQPL